MSVQATSEVEFGRGKEMVGRGCRGAVVWWCRPALDASMAQSCSVAVQNGGCGGLRARQPGLSTKCEGATGMKAQRGC